MISTCSVNLIPNPYPVYSRYINLSIHCAPLANYQHRDNMLYRYEYIYIYSGAMLRAGRARVLDSMRSTIFFSIYLILPAALGTGVYTASNINVYQKEKNNVFLGTRAWSMHRADNLTAICGPIV
jgi:hypothetical protein